MDVEETNEMNKPSNMRVEEGEGEEEQVTEDISSKSGE